MPLPVEKSSVTLSPLAELALAIALGGLLTLAFFSGSSSPTRWAFFVAASLITFVIVFFLTHRRGIRRLL